MTNYRESTVLQAANSLHCLNHANCAAVGIDMVPLTVPAHLTYDKVDLAHIGKHPGEIEQLSEATVFDIVGVHCQTEPSN